MAKLKNTPARTAALDRLKVKNNNRLILTLDGGGIRGIMTIQLLKKLEQVAGIPCYELFDLVAGTSTGGIIAGLIANGMTADKIEQKYIQFVERVFHKRLLGGRFVNPPKYNKDNFRDTLKEEIGNITLADACKENDIDLVISAHDLSAAEETFFTCFNQSNGNQHGTYKDILLRSAIEATMSAPTYFNPLERFIDGGTTTYNNPVLSTIVEAITYSSGIEADIQYDIQNLTVFSFGTGMSREFILPENTLNPSGLDVEFWLNWIMNATGHDASFMQVNTLRSSKINRFIDFRRFQISLDSASINKLPNAKGLDKSKYNTTWLRDIGNETLTKIDMSDVTKFDLMKLIGQQMAEFIMAKGGAFTKDLVENGREMLVTTFGDVPRIKTQMSDPDWLDNFEK